MLSKTINYAVDIHASIGYEFTGDPDGADLANAFKWGVGLNIPACRWFQLHAEVTGKVYGDTTPAQTDATDLIIGPAFWFAKGCFVRPACSYALNYDARGVGGSTAKKSGMQLLGGLPRRNAVLRGLRAARAAPGARQPAAHGLARLHAGHAAPG